MTAYTSMTPKLQVLEGKLEALVPSRVNGRLPRVVVDEEDEPKELFPDDDGMFMINYVFGLNN